MKLLNFTIIKLTCCLVTGILVYELYPVSLSFSISATAILTFLLFLFFLIAKKQFQKTIWFGLTSFILMISTGILTSSFHDQKNASNHYTSSSEYQKDTLFDITFKIKEVLKSNTYYDKYVIDILKIRNESVCGTSLLNIKKDSLQNTLNVDDITIYHGRFEDIHPPLNPNQFNYKAYLKKQYIYHQIFADSNTLFRTGVKKKTLFGIAYSIKTGIIRKLKQYSFRSDELAIISAILLGERRGISSTIYRDYANAGAIHILAISGLHVGILLLILNNLLRPIEILRHGKLLKALFIVLFLWFFAFVTGLSASVIRAVTMFSVVSIAMNLKRPTNIYNTLTISMFLILLFKPLFLFDVGFQLSYLAVLAIVSLDPLLYALWNPKLWILDKLWHTLTVTISAQFGILPLSLFYFHQFPGLFFVSNLIIVPLLGVVLGFGILIIALALADMLPTYLAHFFGMIINYMNQFVKWVTQQEVFIFKDISFNSSYLIASFILIIAITKLLKSRSFKTISFLLCAVLCFQIALIYTESFKPSNQFIIFHKNRHSILGNVRKNSIFVAYDLDSISWTKSRVIKDFTVGNHISNIKAESIKPVYLFPETKLLVVDSLGVYNIGSFQPDYVLLRQSPKINLNRLIDSIQPKHIIADGSNYQSYINYWEATCKKRKLPFYHTGKKGAFIIDY